MKGIMEMSEKIANADTLTAEAGLPKWDRSPEGTHNAIKRIAEYLIRRASRLSDGTSNIVPYGDGKHIAPRENGVILERRGPGKYGGWIQDYFIGIFDVEEGQKATVARYTPYDELVEGKLHRGFAAVVTTTEGVISASRGLQDKNNRVSAEGYVHTRQPADVRDAAARILMQVRGGVAEAEGGARKSILDFIDGNEG